MLSPLQRVLQKKFLQQASLQYSPRICRYLTDDAVPTEHLPRTKPKSRKDNYPLERGQLRYGNRLIDELIAESSTLSPFQEDNYNQAVEMSNEIQKLCESLQDLKITDYSSPDATHKTNCKADRALNLIFQIGCKKLKLTEEEKKTIGDLLGEVLKPIQINIGSTFWKYRKHLESGVLRKRSALQFLTDDFGDLPVGDSKVSKLLQESNIQESKSILDKIISNFAGESDSEEGNSEEEIEAGARVLPRSHTWWFQ